MFRFNFSGHPVRGFDIAPFFGTEFPTAGEELQQVMREILLALPHRKDLLAGEIAEVILPGLSQAAAILLAEWHGQYGNFPRIRWAVREGTSLNILSKRRPI